MSGNLSEITIPDATVTARGLMTPSQVVDLNEVSYRETAAAAEETVIDAADELGFKDTSESLWKRISWTNIKTALNSIFVLLAGNSGGQTLSGGTATGENLTLNSNTAHDGLINFGDNSAYDEDGEKLGIGTSAPTYGIHLVRSTLAAEIGIQASGSNAATIDFVNGDYNFKIVNGSNGFSVIQGPTFDTKFNIDGDTGQVSFGNYSWPIADGTTGQIPSTNGAGVISWIDAPAGGSGYWLQGTGYLYPATAGDAVRVGDGGVTFVLDSDTGVRRSGTNTMELFAGTQVKATIATTGVTIPTLAVTSLDIDRLKPTGGTTAAPTFAKLSDIDTGVNLAGLNVMELVAGAQAKATITTTGVTIPTLTVTTLTIDRLKPTGGTTALPEFSIPGDTNTGVHLATLDVLELVTAAQSRITISGKDISIGMDTADFVAFFGGTPVARQAELTDELADNLTAITHTSPTTPDYAIQDLTDTGGFGFATKDEGNTVLAQIRELQLQVKNLRTRNIQLENTLAAYNLIADVD